MDLCMSKDVWGSKYKDLTVMADYRVHEKVIEILKRRNLDTCHLLDIACGEGALTQRIKDYFPDYEIDVNDINPDNIKFNNFKHIYGLDLNKSFSFRDQYDLVIAIEIIEHLENPWSFLRGVKTILKKGGQLILSTPNINSIKDRIFFLVEGYHIYFGKRGIENSSGHINMIPRWEFEYICSKIGMPILHVDYIGELPSGWRTKLIKPLFFPFFSFMKDKNDASIYIFSVSNP